jgi:hypothetical protein
MIQSCHCGVRIRRRKCPALPVMRRHHSGNDTTKRSCMRVCYQGTTAKSSNCENAGATSLSFSFSFARCRRNAKPCIVRDLNYTGTRLRWIYLDRSVAHATPRISTSPPCRSHAPFHPGFAFVITIVSFAVMTINYAVA